MNLKTLVNAWNQFWFAPASPVPLALFRIFLSLIMLQDLIFMRLPDWRLYYSEHSLIPLGAHMVDWWGKDPYFDILAVLPQLDSWRYGFLIIYGVLSVFLLFGLFTRFTSVSLFLMNLSLNNHFELNQNDGDVFIKLTLMMLCFSNCGDALSLDNLIRACRSDWRVTGFRPRLAPQWPLRMIQMQMAIAYFHTFLCKLTGHSWVSGDAVYYALRYEEMVHFPLASVFDQYWFLKVLTWGTLVIEAALCSLIWIRELRYWVLVSGLLLHLGIDYSMNLPFFEWLFMSTYIVFVYPEDLSKAMTGVTKVFARLDGPPYPVAFDGSCVFCLRTVAIFHRLDVLGRFRFLNFRDRAEIAEFPEFDYQKAENRLQLKLKDRWLEGFDAFRFMSTRLPLLAPFSLFLYLPGISFLGHKAYDFVAANRYLILGGSCESSQCAVSSSAPSQVKA